MGAHDQLGLGGIRRRRHRVEQLGEGFVVTVSGQHRGIADEVNAFFGVSPDHDLDVLRPGLSLLETDRAIFGALAQRWTRTPPDAVVVQGDTSTAMLAALAGFHAGARVVHLEAGLRSGDLGAPFPEEGNRRIIAPISSLHLAPTASAAANLRREGIAPDLIVVTGNTGIDALHRMLGRPRPFTDPRLEEIVAGPARIVLVTVHRRESWGAGILGVAAGVRDALATRPDTVAVLPMHPNPRVRDDLRAAVGADERIVLCEPLSYPQFGRLLAQSHCVVTDSGGVQEEAPALAVPVLVARETTERWEGVEAGAALVVGTRRERIAAELARLLDDRDRHARMARAVSPYGDGTAAPRAADAIEALLGVAPRRAAAAAAGSLSDAGSPS